MTEPLAWAEEAIATTSRRAGAHDEILALYRQHHRALVRFASFVAPEDGMAEDLVQDAFVRLYKARGRVQDPDKIPAYLRTTIVNLARGRGRHLGVVKRKRPAPPPDVASAEEGALAGERHREVVAALRQLSERQRACLVLRYYEELTETEIADELGISVGSVRTHVARGRAALAQLMGEPR